MAAKISINGKWTYVLNVYNPCKNISLEEFEHYFSQLGSDLIIMGDFNAHHYDWEHGNHRITCHPNISGRSLSEALGNSSTITLLTPPGLETRMDPYSGKPATLDLTLGAGCYTNPSQVKTGHDIGSDHLPVEIEFGPPVLPAKIPIRPKWSIKEELIKDWQCELEKEIFPRHDDTVAAYLDFKDRLTNFSKKYFRLKNELSLCTPGKPWWNEEVCQAVARRRLARNKLYRYPSQENTIAHNRAKAIARRTIVKAKTDSWNEFLQSANSQTSTSQMWKVFKAISGTGSPTTSYPLTSEEGNPLDSKGIANKLANYLSNIFNAPTSTQLTTFNSSSSLQNLQNKEYNAPFTLQELQEAIDKLEVKSTHGVDNITNLFLKKLPVKHHPALLNIFNKSWRKAEIPEEWKLAHIITFPKPGRDPTLESSYRPISILSCLGKTLERMIVARLHFYLESKDLLHNYQFGFRPNRSTLDPLLLMEHDIQNALRCQEVVLVVFFDIEKAFDSVPHQTILSKMTKLGITGNLFNWYQEFLTNRKFQVVVDGTFSECHDITNGVPQGAVSSPSLFNIAMHDFTHTHQVTTSVFADDVSMYTVQDSFAEAKEALQIAINNFHQWCSTWGLQVNPGKSAVMYFTRKRAFQPPILHYGSTPIPLEKERKFLGLTFDSPTLTWASHIKRVKEKCAKRLNLLKIVANSKFGCSRSILIKYYKACIRSIIDYGYPIYGSTSPSNYKHLQIIQNSAIRIILGAWRSSSIVDMHVEIAIPMLMDHHKNVVLSHFWKVQNYPPEHPVHFKLADAVPNYIYDHENLTFEHKIPFVKRARNLAIELNIQSRSDPLQTLSPIPPWNSLKSSISINLTNHINKTQPAVARLTSFLITLAYKYPDYFFIYTDGSKSKMEDIVNVGAAIYIPDLPLALQWKLEDNHSIIAAELFAILKALHWITEHAQPAKYVICSDSLSSLQLLSRLKPQTYKSLVFDIHYNLFTASHLGFDIKLQWTPAHCGINGNEQADQAAKNTTFLPITPLILDKAELNSIHQRNLNERVCNSWENNAHRFKIGIYKPKFEIWPWAERKNRYEETLLSNFRLGNPPLNKYLYQAKIIPSRFCSWCPGITEDAEHYFFNCRLYCAQRCKLIQNLRTLNIRNPTLVILLGGGGFSPHKNTKILDFTSAYCRETKCFYGL